MLVVKGKLMSQAENVERAIWLIHSRGPLSSTEIGETLFGGVRVRQAYARPGGKVCHAAKRLGQVEQYFDNFYNKFLWRLTADGRKAAKQMQSE